MTTGHASQHTDLASSQACSLPRVRCVACDAAEISFYQVVCDPCYRNLVQAGILSTSTQVSPMKSFEQIAKAAHQAYMNKAVGKTVPGQSLPTFEQLDEDHRACWLAAVQAVVAEMATVH